MTRLIHGSNHMPLLLLISARSGYNFFFQEEAPRLQEFRYQETGHRSSYSELARLVGRNWKNLSREEKAPYQAMAIQDRSRFGLELIQWQEQQHQLRALLYPQAQEEGEEGDEGDATDVEEDVHSSGEVPNSPALLYSPATLGSNEPPPNGPHGLIGLNLGSTTVPGATFQAPSLPRGLNVMEHGALYNGFGVPSFHGSPQGSVLVGMPRVVTANILVAHRQSVGSETDTSQGITIGNNINGNNNAQCLDTLPEVPVMVEYANFDPYEDLTQVFDDFGQEEDNDLCTF